VRAIRLLLGKDLRVLGRSPALVVALLVYPLLVALLVGLVARYAADRPRVAFVDLDDLPEVLEVGSERFDVDRLLAQVEDEVELVPLEEEEAKRRLESGEVVAVLVVPRGFVSRLRGMVTSPELELRTSRSGLSGEVERQTEALVYNLNLRLQKAYIDANLRYIELIRKGGEATLLGNEFSIIGLEGARDRLAEIEAETSDPEVERRAEELRVFVEQALLALELSDESLRATASPIGLEKADEGGRTWLLSARVQAYALGLTLTFFCVLLAAAAIASERDENVLGRLARGLVRVGELVAEKVALAATGGLALGLVLAVAFGLAVELAGSGGQPWARLALLAPGLALAGATFGALGVLLGALAREARVAALVALLVTLPLALLGLLPQAAVAPAAWISDGLPFAHAVDLFETALFDESPWGRLGREAAWLAGLGLAFATAARIGVRRFLL
jgi:ABC-2 type transport system permease protein